MISYLVLLLDSLRDDSLFCYSVSLVGPVGVNVLTVNYLVSSNFVVVSGTLLQALSVLVGLLCGCDSLLVALGLLGGLPYLISVSCGSIALYGPLNSDGTLLSGGFRSDFQFFNACRVCLFD